ncbi:phospholipase, patatin family [delta proteobacterium NaphS2]|nr:phospholipase, patatin family [delta proteobacterium NaphS2]
MGITIVQKSDLKHPKPNPKVALVLSGGGISGGAFKIGGLNALSSFMTNRRLRDFDIFVGVSAGAIIASFLANGVSSKDLSDSLEGLPGKLTPVRAWDLYTPNFKGFFQMPPHIIGHMLSMVPKRVADIVRYKNIFREGFRSRLIKTAMKPTYKNVGDFLAYCLKNGNPDAYRSSWPWHYLPNGIFTTHHFERAIRKNLESHGLSNDFKDLYKKRGKALYTVSMNLDCARRAVFGHDEINTVPISRAMEASMAIPFFYRPVNIDGVDYVDGAMIKTTNLDLAVSKNADLIICYNPFRPFNLDLFCERCEANQDRIRIAKDGIYAIFNQVMRTMLHTRLMHGILLYQKNPEFKGDIILVEPTEYDDKFFDMNPINFWERRVAAKRGYDSVRESISKDYKILNRILTAHGIKTNPKFAAPPRQDEVLAMAPACQEPMAA